MRCRMGLAVLLAFVCFTGAAEAQATRARQGLLSLEDGRLFYEVLGSGEPIIIVHGGPGLDHGYLRPGLDVISGRNSLVYYDQRGTGRSDAALDSSGINIQDFVEDIESLRQALEFDRVTVLGHSFGAVIAVEYALRHPDRLRSLILMNPTEPGRRFADETAARQAKVRSAEDRVRLAELMASEGYQARDAATLSEVYRTAFRGAMRSPDRVSEVNLGLAPATARNGQDVAALLGSSMGEVDLWDEIATIQVPTLVIHGRFDVSPIAMSQALAEAFPLGTLAVLESGHFPYVEDSAGLVTAIAGFLSRIAR